MNAVAMMRVVPSAAADAGGGAGAHLAVWSLTQVATGVAVLQLWSGVVRISERGGDHLGRSRGCHDS